MRAPAVVEQRRMPTWRAAWRCSANGFAAVAPLSGDRAALAVGTVGPSSRSPGPGIPSLTPVDVETARAVMRSVLTDQAMVEGHDARILIDRCNAALSLDGSGRVHSLALLSRSADGVPPCVIGVGRPAPVVVTPDHLTAPADGTVGLAGGWSVVLCVDDASRPVAGLLGPADVRLALSLVSAAPGLPAASPGRTLLTVTVDG